MRLLSYVRNWRRLLRWGVFAMALVGIAWGLDALLPPEPRWSARGRFDPSGFGENWPLLMLLDSAPHPGNGPGGNFNPMLIDSRSGNRLGAVFPDAGDIRSWACSADGRLVAAATADGSVRIADTRSGEEWQADTGDTGPFGLRFSPDGEYLLLTRPDRKSHLVHAPSGKVIHSFVMAPLPCAFSPRGDYLIYHTADPSKHATLHIWDVRHDAAVAHVDGAEYLAIGSDGNTLYVRQREPNGPRFDRVILWDIAAARRQVDIPIPPSEDIRLTLAADERTAAILAHTTHGTNRTHITFWELPAVRQIADTRLPAAGTNTAFSPDGLSFAAEAQARVAVLDVNTGRERWHLATGRVSLWPDILFFTPDSQTLVLRSSEGLQWRDAATGEQRENRCETGQFAAPRSRAWQRGRLLVYDTPGWSRIRQAGWLEQQMRRWLPASWLPPEGDALGAYVFDAGSRRTLFEQAEPELVSALLSDDGATVLTIHATEGGEQLLRCYDVPARKPLRWVLGVPLGIAAVLLTLRYGWRRWRRRPAAAAAAQGGAPCP